MFLFSVFSFYAVRTLFSIVVTFFGALRFLLDRGRLLPF